MMCLIVFYLTDRQAEVKLEETNRALVNNDANTLNNTQRLLYVCLNFAAGFGAQIYKNGSA